MNVAAPENTAKAPPFETGATIRSPVECIKEVSDERLEDSFYRRTAAIQ
jgi:hypothetical protein